jgi:hypothetical protein
MEIERPKRVLNYGPTSLGFLQYVDKLEAYANKLEEKINYTCCCTELKGKEELTFSQWCEVNKYIKTKNGTYVDTQHLWFTEKALLKIYNLDIDLQLLTTLDNTNKQTKK